MWRKWIGCCVGAALFGAAVLAAVLPAPAIAAPFSPEPAASGNAPERLVREAKAALAAGDVQAAVVRLREAIRLDSGNIEAYAQLGHAYRRLGVPERARDAYEKALEIGGPRADLYQNLGVVEALGKRFRSASERFESAVDLAPEKADLYHNLGNAYQEQARFEEAARAFEKALALDPSDLDSAASLGRLLVLKGESKHAIRLLSAALEGRPDHGGVCYRLGLALLNEAQPGRAVEYLQRAIRVDPSLEGAWLNLARAAEAAGRMKLSREAYARFSRLYEQTRAREAESNLLAQRIELEVPAHYARAQELVTENRLREAIGEFEKILELQPNDAPTLMNLGRLHATLGNRDQARNFLERAIRADPTYAHPLLDLARLDLERGLVRDALEGAERAIALEPELGEAWLLRGAILAGLEDWKASIAAFETAARLLPDSPEPHLWLASAYAKLGRADDAKQARARARSVAVSASQGGAAGGPP
ncbi:MAG: tetratricopeptide repeat protein [Acidobacteriota bacterium]